jgi:hypothetical protein
MSIERANRLKEMTQRLEGMINMVKSGEVELTKEHESLIDQLDETVTQYEDILNGEDETE